MKLQLIPPSPEVLRALYEEFLLKGQTIGLTFEKYLEFIGFGNHSHHHHGMDDPHDPHPTVARASEEAPQLVSVPHQMMQGNLRVMVLLVDFNDKPGTLPVSHYEDLLFSKNSHSTGSMRDFFNEVSLGKVDVTGEVHGWLRLPNNYSFYTNNESGTEWNSYPRNAPRMAEDAVAAAVAQGVAFNQNLDALNDNTVTALFIIHSGEGAEVQQTPALRNANIWSHKWAVKFPPTVAPNLRVTRYLTVPHDARLGVCAHELGHLAFQWEDFYDPDYAKNGQWDGAGDWDLMAGGSYNGSSNSPAHPIAWHKSQHGWIELETIRSSQRITLPPFTATSGNAFKLVSSQFTSSQYLILENRTRFGFDSFLPGEGLLVWRVDEVREMVSPTRPALQLVQADGQRDLETVGDSNQGDSGDPFPGSTNVDSLLTSGRISTSFPQGNESGIELLNIRRDPSTGVITLDAIFDGVPVDVQPPPSVVDPTVVLKVSEPDRIIPDNDPTGIADSVNVTETGSVRAVTVGVDIGHSYIGDLHVELVSPTGQKAVLHRLEGGVADNLVRTWSTTDTAALAVFNDASVQGNWTLRVSDRALRDTGRLKRWSLALDVVQDTRSVNVTQTPNKPVPDNDPAGISDVIHVAHGGTVRSVKVSVDIPHPFIGDLRVELVSPSGDRALLHNKTGGDADNLKQAWASNSDPQLAVFAAKSVRGDWVLRVSDHAGRDQGTFKEWTIEIDLAPTQIKTTEQSQQPAVAIPDNNAAGVGSPININEVGTAQSLAVDVDIRHPYVGDLRVELIAPSGELAVLHNKSGGGRDDLQLSLNSDTSPVLQQLVGQPIQGNWILRAIDTDRLDEGTLMSWTLRIDYAG